MPNNLEYFHSRVDAIRDDLQNASESISELATSLLREAIEGDQDALLLEKSIQKARRSLSKAIQVLGSRSLDYDNE